MRRHVAAGIFATTLLTVGAGSVIAASANVTPSSQVHAHGVASHWTLSWGGTSPYHVEFYLGDGTVDIWQSTTIVGASDSYTFWPCTTTVFHQTLKAWDGWNDQYKTYKGDAQDSSTAQESGGAC